jgi:hypothetical protein
MAELQAENVAFVSGAEALPAVCVQRYTITKRRKLHPITKVGDGKKKKYMGGTYTWAGSMVGTANTGWDIEDLPDDANTTAQPFKLSINFQGTQGPGNDGILSWRIWPFNVTDRGDAHAGGPVTTSFQWRGWVYDDTP